MKKVIVFVLAMLMCVSLAACGENSEGGVTETTQIASVAIPDKLLPFAQAMYGEWKLVSEEVVKENPYTAIVIREDGTCLVNGKECTWKYDNQNSNDKNLIIKIFDGAEHICGGQISTSLDGLIFYFRAMEAPFVFCPGVWERSE